MHAFLEIFRKIAKFHFATLAATPLERAHLADLLVVLCIVAAAHARQASGLALNKYLTLIF